METPRSVDVTRVTLQILAIGALIVSSFLIVRPFLVPLTWATTIVVATWPGLLRVQSTFGGRRPIAVAVMTTALVITLLLPLFFVITTLLQNTERIEGWSSGVATMTIPGPPQWVESIPLAGSKLAAGWRQLAAAGPSGLSDRLIPFARTLGLWFIGQVGSIAAVLLQFVLTVIIAAILYANGERAVRGVDQFARRLAGVRGENAVHLAGLAIRAVAQGVVVTAVLQAVLGGIGLAIAGVPFATFLTALMFVLAVAQIGAAPVLIASAIWVYMTSGTVWGTGLLLWAILCGTIDNFIRPLLIKRGADLPLLLIFTGVIGGLVALGIIGLFIGPVVLAVGYTLLVEWISEAPADRSTA